MEPRHRKQHDDEHEDDEYVDDEHNADVEMMLKLPSVAQNGMKLTQFAQYYADQGDPELSNEVSEEHDEANEPELIQLKG